MNRLIILMAMAVLSGCTKSPSTVRITDDVPPPVVRAKPLAVSKSEPVFYNGKTYRVDLAPAESGSYLVSVSGMTAKQEKDAMGLSQSAFHHFSCKDSQSTKFLNKIAYSDTKWSAMVRCG